MNPISRQRRSSLVLVFVLGAILIIVVIVIGLGGGRNPNLPLDQDGTLPPPLANVEFPSQPVQYPVDWPDELLFPDEFTLVDSASGSLPESTAQGWSAKLRYQGNPPEAMQVISTFLEEKGWAITENHQFDSGGFVLLIQKGQGEGIVTLDSDPTNNSQTLILATIFP